MDTLVKLQSLLQKRSELIENKEIKVEDKVAKADELSAEIRKVADFKVVELVFVRHPKIENSDCHVWMHKRERASGGNVRSRCAWKIPWRDLEKLPKAVRIEVYDSAPWSARHFGGYYTIENGVPKFSGGDSTLFWGVKDWHVYFRKAGNTDEKLDCGLAMIGIDLGGGDGDNDNVPQAMQQLGACFARAGIEVSVDPVSAPADFPPSYARSQHCRVRFIERVEKKSSE